jgi:hypothetical protein
MIPIHCFQKILKNFNSKVKERNFFSIEKKLLISNQIISFNYNEYKDEEEEEEKSNYENSIKYSIKNF